MLRRGASLVELVVALLLGAVVLSVALGSLLRQQRTTAGLVASGRNGAQLRTGAALLPAQLALSSPHAGDLVEGQQSDTALQLRVLVAGGESCGGDDRVTLDPDAVMPGGAGVASAPRAGDSLWWYRADSSQWTGRLVRDASPASATCSVAAEPDRVRTVFRVLLEGVEPVPARVPLRVMRQVRLVVYRSGDGTWQLGLREWSDATHSLSAPQPVAGPFQRTAADGGRTGFRYLDSLGTELPLATQPELVPRTARIRFTGIVPTPAGSRRDSADVVLRPDRT